MEIFALMLSAILIENFIFSRFYSVISPEINPFVKIFLYYRFFLFAIINIYFHDKTVFL